ncbi:GGDEF domain-containing protein [Streptomyces silvisoli]|uniref:GGDEF domain-containing protein n=1 Tax=Streptomyces silvisoli TaxID=3034235 RepID=A0ABT5ZEX7_9ACTN|nr:GGDEF domain-containing protein [Streptomyces silvisoli]MDF3288361.1 GGDEF domain-containing protein [Streptomyces silvisoli]
MSAVTDALAAVGAVGWSEAAWMRHRLNRARRDPLTALPLRPAFERRAARLIRRGPVASVVIDLDGFKAVNDTFGHAAGDAAIREIGARLAEWADGLGVVARLGGDEFAAVLPLGDWDLWVELVSLHEWLCQPVPFDGRSLVLGASIGAAFTLPGRPAGYASLMRRADEAMFEAKGKGGGCLLTEAPTPVIATVNGCRAGRPGTHDARHAEGGAW